ncbi:DUF397 domain-containing protein [Streptomyces coelicoflavus]|uniref:DUF397 domain-containing protein n=1 Tax=Streptomyces coelicoflavus TaxID=285562 RepID=UPI0036A28090
MSGSAGHTPTGPVQVQLQVAITEQAVWVRDSKDVTRPYFTVGRDHWSRFVGFATEV